MVLVFRSNVRIVAILCASFFAFTIGEVTSAAPLRSYAEVVYGCTSLAGNCVNVRYGPGTRYNVATKARMGVVFEVNGSVLKEGRMWYRIQQDTDLVHPERVRGVWYIASDFVRVHRYPGKQFSGAATSQTGKYIVIDISSQTLTAYQGKKVFLSAHVSTGLTGTPTPKGTFTIIKKQPSRYMQGPLPGISKQYYDLPGVPWNLYFTSQGAAIHGAYWHSNFGAQHSHGCVNLPVKTAKLLYDWTPVETTVFVQK